VEGDKAIFVPLSYKAHPLLSPLCAAKPLSLIEIRREERKEGDYE
jgi:hypothetical protein